MGGSEDAHCYSVVNLEKVRFLYSRFVCAQSRRVFSPQSVDPVALGLW